MSCNSRALIDVVQSQIGKMLHSLMMIMSCVNISKMIVPKFQSHCKAFKHSQCRCQNFQENVKYQNVIRVNVKCKTLVYQGLNSLTLLTQRSEPWSLQHPPTKELCTYIFICFVYFSHLIARFAITAIHYVCLVDMCWSCCSLNS